MKQRCAGTDAREQLELERDVGQEAHPHHGHEIGWQLAALQCLRHDERHPAFHAREPFE
jgi:hypothetical protein